MCHRNILLILFTGAGDGPSISKDCPFVFYKKKRKIFKIVIYFLAETRSPIIKVSEEHHGYGWFLYRDALKMLMYDNLKDNLKRANDLVSKKSLRGSAPNPKGKSFNVSGDR